MLSHLITVYRHRVSVDPMMPDAGQGSHWSVNFYVNGMTRPGKIRSARAGIEPRVCRSRGGRLNHWANEAVRGRELQAGTETDRHFWSADLTITEISEVVISDFVDFHYVDYIVDGKIYFTSVQTFYITFYDVKTRKAALSRVLT